MKRIANDFDQVLEIAAATTNMGNGFPIFVIPWGMGNIPHEDFFCQIEEDARGIWEKYVAPVQTPAFRRVHVIHCPRLPDPK